MGGVLASQGIADSMKGPINNVTFLAAPQKAEIDLPGGPPADSAKKSDAFTGAFLNEVNWAVTFDVVHDGTLVPWDQGRFSTMTNAVLGKPLPKTDISPKGEKS